MLASNPTTIIDMYRLLPPNGEDAVSFQYDGSQLRVKIDYEDESNPSMSRRLVVVFEGVVLMNVSSVPGIELLSVQCAGDYPLRNIVEYTKSEAADAWSAHFGWAIHHFDVYFPNVNERFVVFARRCGIES